MTVIAIFSFELLEGVVGFCYGPGYPTSAGASYSLDDSRARAYCKRQGPTALAVDAVGGCLDIFTPIYLFSPLFLSLSGGRPDID